MLVHMVESWRSRRSTTSLSVEVHETANLTGIRFESFKRLYDSMSAANKAGILTTEPPVHTIECWYEDDIKVSHQVGCIEQCHKHQLLTRTVTSCVQRSEVQFEFKHMELSPVALGAPSTPSLYELSQVWAFHYKNRFRYLFKKSVRGVDKAQACKTAPTYHLLLSIVDDVVGLSDRQLADSFVAKTLDLAGRYDLTTETLVTLSISPDLL